MANLSAKPASELSHRLPTTVIPSHYQLYIDVAQLEKYLYKGIVDIDIQVR